MKRAGSSTERQRKGPCRPPWARDGRGHRADSDGGGGLPASLPTHTRPREGRAFLGTGNGGRSPPGPALVTMVTVTGLRKTWYPSSWQASGSVPHSVVNHQQIPSPPRVGSQDVNATRGQLRKPSSDLTGGSSRFPCRGLCVCSSGP